MYSVILMAALTTNTADAPAFHKHGGSCYGGIGLHSGAYCSCMGAWGGCYGGYGAGACYGCMGYGGGYGQPYGGWYGYGAPAPYTPSENKMVVPGSGTMPDKPVPPATPPVTPEKPAVPPSARLGTYGAPAKLVIEKPVDAKLFVDSIPIAADAASKTFTTPELVPNQAYYYMVRIEMTREGKPVTETRRVIVRAGETATETFREPNGITTAAK
jgi:uncharacterized protein (TIGR03000 family)